MKQSLLCFLAMLLLPAAFTARGTEIPATYSELEPLLHEALDEFPDILARRNAHVDSLKMRFYREGSPDRAATLLREVISEYCTLNADSLSVACLRGMDYARDNDLEDLAQWIALNQARLAGQMGFFIDAARDVDIQFQNGICPANRRAAFLTRASICFDAASFHHGSRYADKFIKEGRIYIDSLKQYSYDGSTMNVLLNGLCSEIDGNYDIAIANYSDVLRSNLSGQFERSRAAVLLGILYDRTGNPDLALYNYALGALYDLKSGDVTSPSLPLLGFELVSRGENDLGQRILLRAYANTSDSRIAHQATMFSQWMPPVIDDVVADNGLRSTRTWIIITAFVLLLVFLISQLLISRRHLQTEQKRNEKLQSSNRLKEDALGRFLELSAVFQERFEDFTKLARRKISAGQANDLLDSIKQGRILGNTDDEIFSTFDRSVLRIFPKFVDEINSLLDPGKKITTPGNVRLTPELRVAVFSRLGIDDASTVSRFLGLSVNTVYTYRNKLRSRALSRKTFDDDLLKVGRAG